MSYSILLKNKSGHKTNKIINVPAFQIVKNNLNIGVGPMIVFNILKNIYSISIKEVN